MVCHSIKGPYGLVSKYGEASASLSCDMYDYMADLMDADVPEAIPAETATINEVARGVTWGKYHSPSQISSVVSRQVRQAGADTMIQNAKRDNAEWAWVPQGDTCAFCITLASRGWQSASKTVLRGRHAEHIHQNCDCTFAIAFKEKDKRQYDYIYDPERYRDMYYDAMEEEGGSWSDAVNHIRRNQYKQNREYIRAQQNDAYQAKFFSSIEKIKELQNNQDEERPMAQGHRNSVKYILNEEDQQYVIEEAEAISIPKDIFRFNYGKNTSYVEEIDKINIRGDIFPDNNSSIARDRLSVRAVLAHEFYGHRANSPSEYEINDWRDEFRASYDAAVNAPNLSQQDRAELMVDAYDRAREAGFFIEYDKVAKRLIYGYEDN